MMGSDLWLISEVVKKCQWIDGSCFFCGVFFFFFFLEAVWGELGSDRVISCAWRIQALQWAEHFPDYLPTGGIRNSFSLIRLDCVRWMLVK